MDIDLERIIPSASYRAYLKENDIDLSSLQLAKLIYVSDEPMEWKWSAYRSLIAAEKADTKLCEQLQAIIAYEEVFVKAELKEKPGAVYKLEEFDSEDRQWNEMGIYVSIHDAERIGRKIGHDFSITRYLPKKFSEKEFSAIEERLKESGYLDTADQTFFYNAEGQLTSMNRMNDAGSEESESYRRYTDADEWISRIFADFPICFKNGNIIRSTGTYGTEGLYGIVHIFPNREEENKRIAAIPGLVPDDELLTEFLYKDGYFEHHHILVTELEKVDLEQIPESQRDVLICASTLLNGRGTFQDLQYMIAEMKRNKKQEQN